MNVTNTSGKVSKYGVFSGPFFPVFGLNTERYRVSLRILSECGKMWTRKNSVFGHFSHSDISLLSIIIITHAIKNSNSSFSIHHMNLQFLANSFEPRIIIQFKKPTKICYKGYTYITLWVKLVKFSRTKNMGNGSK